MRRGRRRRYPRPICIMQRANLGRSSASVAGGELPEQATKRCRTFQPLKRVLVVSFVTPNRQARLKLYAAKFDPAFPCFGAAKTARAPSRSLLRVSDGSAFSHSLGRERSSTDELKVCSPAKSERPLLAQIGPRDGTDVGLRREVPRGIAVSQVETAARLTFRPGATSLGPTL